MLGNNGTQPVPLNAVKVKDLFWHRYMELVRKEAIPYQWEAMNDRVPGVPPSHAIENFRIAAGLSRGEFYGYVFQDSDVAKWLEAVSYSLATHPDKKLERLADEVIELIGRAQQPDGYLNTYFTIKEPSARWSNERDKHELYCSGHMMEAAVAYFNTTGKRKLLDIMCKNADHIDGVFGPEEGKKRGYPGHQGIELALVKLYKATGNGRYLKLGKFFIDERGKQPGYFEIEAKARGMEGDKGLFGDYSDEYRQSHLPVREQNAAVGHAVRAVYMYAGMADVAAEAGDESLAAASEAMWKNVTNRQMYITGGLGSQGYGEDFTFDYDLPNDTCYTETCAAVGLVFWARSMQGIDMDGKYADILEKALYNGVISGMSLDGNKYFYVNPLEVWPQACKKRYDLRDVATTRQGWFGCACCPPNLARLISSLGGYIHSAGRDIVFTHLYMGSEAVIEINGKKVTLTQKTNYPWDGKVEIYIEPECEVEFTMAVRIPGWCGNASVKADGREISLAAVTEKGYAKIKRLWSRGSRIEMVFPMPVRRIKANPEVREDAGRVALQRGPLVYCLEEADNSGRLADIVLEKEPGFTAEYEEELLGGVVAVRGAATRSNPAVWGDELYKDLDFEKVPVTVKAVPYYAWNNRGEGEMTVWIRQAGI